MTEELKKLYHLKDELGWYQNVIYVCGGPVISKNLDRAEAAIYTEHEMISAKAFFAKRKIRVVEHEIVKGPKRGPVGKTWKKNEKHSKSSEIS